jgi:short-subunit dehydrogenase
MILSGARVVVTGASRGIGAELARACAARGARVALVARSKEHLYKLAADLGGNAYPADLADATAIDSLVGRIEADGPIDVLVNNAGIDLTGALTDLPAEQIAQLIDINLLAPMLLCRAALPGMQARGRGHILNVSSLSGTNALPGVLPYSASKAGLSHFTAGLRAELKGTPITTTLAQIGPVESSMIDSLRAHGPTRRALARLATLQLTYDLEMSTVVDALVAAIETERRHVRLPKRDAMFPILTEAPRRITEWLLVGVR